MKIANSAQSGLALWITFPDFLSSGWIAQQEMIVLNTIERKYGKTFASGWQQIRVFHKGAALVIQGLEPKAMLEMQEVLISCNMEVSLRAIEGMTMGENDCLYR